MLYEIVIPFGLGHLYAKRYLFALIKFVSFFMIPLLILLIFGFNIVESIKKNLNKFRKDFDYPKIEKEEKKFEYMEYTVVPTSNQPRRHQPRTTFVDFRGNFLTQIHIW